MSSMVTEALRALGSFEIVLERCPQEHVNRILELGHIVVTPVREPAPTFAGDDLLQSARYVGVARVREDGGQEDRRVSIRGCGLAYWLGDEDGVGPATGAAHVYNVTPVHDVIRDLLPETGDIVEGTFYDLPDYFYTGSHQYESPRRSIDYVCDFSGIDWRINNDATLDLGTAPQLFVTNPRAVIVRRAADTGPDLRMQGLRGTSSLQRNAEQLITRVVLLGQPTGPNAPTPVVGNAAIPDNSGYLHLRNGFVYRVKFVSETATTAGNAQSRAQMHLDQYSTVQRPVTLDTTEHDFHGIIEVGDYVWVHDQDAGMVDVNNEVIFRGERLNPVRQRCTSLSWPVLPEMGVYYRTALGGWVDLSDWVVTDPNAATSIEVGKYTRNLTVTGNPVSGRVL